MDKVFYLPFEKVIRNSDGSCVVAGYASTPTRDLDGEIITLDAVRAAMPSYWQYANIREMHQPKAAGVGVDYKFDKTGWWLKAKIVDPVACKKVQEGVYKGFSIGGRKTSFDPDDPSIITGIELMETSIVDRPANPECKMALAKRAKPGAEGYLLKAAKKPLAFEVDSVPASAPRKALKKMAQAVALLAKDGPPAAHDGFSLPADMGKEINPSPKDVTQQNNKAAGACDAHGVVGCKDCAEKAASACAEHGIVNCSVCAEKREFSDKERSRLADSGAALPDGSYPIQNASDLRNAIQAFGRAKDKGKAKAHIKARAKSLGLTNLLPESWGKGKKAKKLAKKERKLQKQQKGGAVITAVPSISSAPLPSFLVLGSAGSLPQMPPEPGSSSPRLKKLGKREGKQSLSKRMSTAGSLSYCFDSIRDAQRSLISEGAREGGDSKDKALATKLGTVARDIAEVISLKATHEGSEALDFSDVDDSYVQSLLEGNMDKGVSLNKENLSPLEAGLVEILQKAAAPSRAQRMQMAMGHMKKVRKARKDAMDAVEECHKALSRSFMSKMEKRAKGKTDGDADDDMAMTEKVLKSLQKAHGALGAIKTYTKAAEANISKAAEGVAGRSGQRGQEAGDAPSGVPYANPGVKDLSPRDIATAGPGAGQRGSVPPMMPDDGGVYPGKMAKFVDKNGNVPLAVAELMAENRAMTEQMEILKRVGGGGDGFNRPSAFDVSKVVGGTDKASNDLASIMFADVDLRKLNSQDEQIRTPEVAKAAGNYLMSSTVAKSVTDPAFRGGAGLRRH